MEIDYWKKYNKIPFDYSKPDSNALYMMAFFDRRRAVLIRKDLTVICTFETRKAKQLLDQAIQRKWVSTNFKDCTLGERPEGYPKEANILWYIEINRP